MASVNESSFINETESCEVPLSWASVMISANLLSTIVGAIGNCLVCIAVWKTASLHTTINYYMVSLAIADLIVTLLVQPLMIAVIAGRLTGRLECTNTLDIVYRAIGNFSCAASFFNLCCISLERFLAVLRPVTAFKSATSKRFIFLVFASWLIALLYSVLRVTASRKGTSYFSAASFTIGYVWMISCYAIILVSLGIQTKRQATITATDTTQRRYEKTITITMILVIACFTIMWLPFFYFRLSGNSSLNSGVVYQLAITVALCNSSFNPIIYSFRSRKYRYAFKYILFTRHRHIFRQTTRGTAVAMGRRKPSSNVWQTSSELRKSSSTP